MNDAHCWLNGRILPLKEAGVGLSDLGLLRGFGIYEGITVIGGKPFHFGDHWKRLGDSAAALGLSIPASAHDIENAIIELAKHNAPNSRASVRLVLTGGPAEGGLEHVPGRETMFITLEPAVPLPASVYENGAKLITHEHMRAFPEYKTVNYTTAVMLQPKRKQADAIEILFTYGGAVLECATSNIFIVKNGSVLTPRESVLPGITRKVVLDLARAHYPVEERAITTEELFSADEVFITSSFKDIVPVREIDERSVTDAPGPITKDLIARFTEYAHTHTLSSNRMCAHQGSNLGPTA